MFDEDGNPSGEVPAPATSAIRTTNARTWSACETHDAYVCSLCLSTDKLGDHVLSQG